MAPIPTGATRIAGRVGSEDEHAVDDQEAAAASSATASSAGPGVPTAEGRQLLERYPRARSAARLLDGVDNDWEL